MMRQLPGSVWLRALALLLFCCWLSPHVAADPAIPTLTGRVVDQAHVIDSFTLRELDDDLARYETQTSTQIVVVTLADLQGYPIEDWGLALLRGWQIGQAGKNNGIVLVVAPNDRKLRIETGYGAEGPLPDATASAIIRTVIVPRFAEGRIPQGITAGVDAIEAALVGSFTPNVVNPSVISVLLRNLTWTGIRNGAIGLGILLFVIYMIVVARRDGLRIYFGGQQYDYWQRTRRSGDPFRGITINFDQTSSSRDNSSSSSGSWSSSSSSSSSGSSSFSGGGGSGGGGGASGSW